MANKRRSGFDPEKQREIEGGLRPLGRRAKRENQRHGFLPETEFGDRIEGFEPEDEFEVAPEDNQDKEDDPLAHRHLPSPNLRRRQVAAASPLPYATPQPVVPQNSPKKPRWGRLILVVLLAMMVIGGSLSKGLIRPSASGSITGTKVPVATATPVAPMLNPHGYYIGWLSGNDCVNGKQAYLDRVQRSPNDVDEAIVGSMWLNPLTGQLIQSSNCDKKDMSDVIDLVHKHGGHVYAALTIDGNAFSAIQDADYIQQAITNNEDIQTIIDGIGNADGLITDIEQVAKDPGIAQAYTQFNLQLEAAVHKLNDQTFGGKKFFGMTLVHKVDDSEYINQTPNGGLYVGFEDWRAVGSIIKPDLVTILAQDEYYTHPGPLATSNWLGDIVLYAQKTMPNLLPKIIWTVFNYGWLWSSTDCNSYTWQHADNDPRLDGHAPLVTYQELLNITAGKTFRPGSNLDDNKDPSAWWSEDVCDSLTVHATTKKSFNYLMDSLRIALKIVEGSHYQHIVVAVWWDTTEAPAKLEQVTALK